MWKVWKLQVIGKKVNQETLSSSPHGKSGHQLQLADGRFTTRESRRVCMLHVLETPCVGIFWVPTISDLSNQTNSGEGHIWRAIKHSGINWGVSTCVLVSFKILEGPWHLARLALGMWLLQREREVRCAIVCAPHTAFSGPNGPAVLPLAEPVVAGGDGSVTELLCRSHPLLAMASLDSRKGDSSLLSRHVMQWQTHCQWPPVAVQHCWLWVQCRAALGW